jgi:hypothetical protein
MRLRALAVAVLGLLVLAGASCGTSTPKPPNDDAFRGGDAGTGVTQSRWAPLEGGALRGYGRFGLYTYVLGVQSNDTLGELALQIFDYNDPAPEGEDRDLSRYNVFLLPVKEGEADALKAQVAERFDRAAGDLPQWYDYAHARVLLDHLCNRDFGALEGRYVEDLRRSCASGFREGPVLLTFDRPLAAGGGFEPPFLMADLGDYSARSYRQVVQTYMQRVTAGGLEDDPASLDYRLATLDLVHRAGERMPEILESALRYWKDFKG